MHGEYGSEFLITGNVSASKTVFSPTDHLLDHGIRVILLLKLVGAFLGLGWRNICSSLDRGVPKQVSGYFIPFYWF